MAKQGVVLQREVGQVTMLVNNAGVVTGRRLLDNSDDEIQRTLRVNLLAHFWVLLLALIIYNYVNMRVCVCLSMSMSTCVAPYLLHILKKRACFICVPRQETGGV